MSRTASGVSFAHPAAFWLGTLAITIGVVIHVWMFADARDMGYVLSMMPMGSLMTGAMVLILVGIAGTVWGLIPKRSEAVEERTSHLRVSALDDAKMGKNHVAMLLVMAFAVTIDVMKPITLGFVVPGSAVEYGLKSPLTPDGTVPVALLPLTAITGTVVGSFVWGYLGDRIGRRASILLSGVLFVATSICGAMPSFGWNLFMCFVMGVGVGGMLPITFALMAETIPARHRGWIMVLVGGDVAGAFILTSALASWLIPTYTWRIMWLVGLPTGLLLLFLNRWIPESPRFLMAHGRDEEARDVLTRYGAKLTTVEHSELQVEDQVKGRFLQLFEGPFVKLSTVVLLFGIGCGLVTFGFQLWIPTNLQKLGLNQDVADGILRNAALIGFPLTFLIAWAYGFWSSKKTLVLIGVITAVSLFAFVLTGDTVVANRPLLYILLVIPITGISSVLAVLITYASEVYPTRIRSRGTGMAGAAAKAGGVAILAMVVMGITPPSIAITALLGAVPMMLASLLALRWGVETRNRRLEAITAEELGQEPGQGESSLAEVR